MFTSTTTKQNMGEPAVSLTRPLNYNIPNGNANIKIYCNIIPIQWLISKHRNTVSDDRPKTGRDTCGMTSSTRAQLMNTDAVKRNPRYDGSRRITAGQNSIIRSGGFGSSASGTYETIDVWEGVGELDETEHNDGQRRARNAVRWTALSGPRRGAYQFVREHICTL